MTKTVEKNADNKTTNTEPITIETTEKAKETSTGQVTTTPVATATVKQDTLLEPTANSLTLVVKEDAVPSNIEVKSDQSAKTLEVKMEGLSTDNTTPVTVEMYVGTGLKNLKLYHTENGTPVEMTEKTAKADVTAHNTYYYDSNNGIITMAVQTFSPFTYIYDATVVETSDELEESLIEGGTTILSKDISFEGTEHEDGDHLDTIISGEYIHLVLNNTLTSDNIISDKAWGLIRVQNTVVGSEITATSKFVISANEDGKFINTTTVSSICIHGGDVIVNSGYFECTNADASCFLAFTDSDIVNSDGPFSLTINGGTFKAETVVYVVNGMNCTVTINGGTFYGWDPGAYVDANHTVSETTDDGVTVYTVTAK